MSDTELEATLTEALKEVLDPELGYNVVDLGLIYGIEVHSGQARIALTTTTRGCPATDYIREGVESCAASVGGISAAEVVMTWEPPWTPDRMSAEAKTHFGVAA
ncbi:MAG: metal-sulfur cluster assembly factor [Burkholderiales bacterium]|nr:metal-sulfur cluster assembly factor [Burkholderiales bacterium]